MSRRTLERVMKDHLGKTPQAWLSEQRLLAAADMLVEYKRPKFVAYSLGFKQLSHFSRGFKLHFGVGPRAFIRLHETI
jgi:AraC-like DNA-binding protein